MRKSYFYSIIFIVSFLSIVVFIFVLYFSQNAVKVDRNNDIEFFVDFNKDFFYCGENIEVTINSNTEITEMAKIKVEFYWKKEPKKDILVQVFYMMARMEKINTLIEIPTRHDWYEYMGDYPFDKKADEEFKIKMYFNDKLISENNEITIACSKLRA